MTPRPRIAVTVGFAAPDWRPEDDRGRWAPYAASIEAAGGDPEWVGVDRAAEVLADPGLFLARYGGLLLTGGADVHPAEYPNPPDYGGLPWSEVLEQHHMRVDEGRDAFELLLARTACDMGKPALGVCRGHQVLNVALGGRLILDLDPALGHKARPDRSSSQHSVQVLRGSKLSAVLGRRGPMEVNSRHHQGVDEAGLSPLLRPSALAADGVVIEGIEAPFHPWLVGVQWHPERPEDAECHEACRPLFEAFVRACAGRE